MPVTIEQKLYDPDSGTSSEPFEVLVATDMEIRDRLVAALADDTVMEAITHGLWMDRDRLKERYYRFLPRLAANLAAYLADWEQSPVRTRIMSSKFDEHMKEWEDARDAIR